MMFRSSRTTELGIKTEIEGILIWNKVDSSERETVVLSLKVYAIPDL